MTSYQSKIIDVLMGPFPFIHDFLRLDLNEENHSFKLHRYYICDGGGMPYTRSFGTYQLKDNQCILKYTKKACISEELDQQLNYYEEFQEIENIYDVDKRLDNVIGLYLSIYDEDLEYDTELREEIYSYKEKYGCLEIKTNKKPFGHGMGHKKIRPYKLRDWEEIDKPSATDCSTVINYFYDNDQVTIAKKYFDKYYDIIKSDKKLFKELSKKF